MVGRSDTATLPAPSGSAADEAVGMVFGRYTVRGLLGRGGMGEVFLAHDPELDRLVAVKVVRAGFAERSPEARARFQREAQAMARLNHPNVVSVYDVGTAGETIYVAMERIDGPTLAAWLAEQPRPLAQVLDVFVQAGRGLAAAHDAGLVHRDFKPSNVMLGDRVRVVDFGLARPDSSADPLAHSDTGIDPLASTADEDPSPRNALDANLTAAGRVLGTPAYMAPEQRHEQRWGPAADQYSFAVALREAVTGRSRHAVEATRPVPRWLRPILARALELEPDARYPSMDRLLVALERGRTRTRRWVMAGAALATAATIAGVGFLASGSAPEPCQDAAPRMAAVWDTPHRAAVRAAFLATGQPYAERTWRSVERTLDEYTRTWIASSADACRATRIEGRLSETVLDRRTACLERARGELDALTRQWITGTDATGLAAAGAAIAALKPLAACNEIDALLERTPPPPALVARIGELHDELDKLRALAMTGRHEQVAAQLPKLVTAVDATGWNQIRAEVRYVQGRNSANLSRPEAEQQLLAANELATAANDDRLAAQALVHLVDYLANNQRTAERALLIASLADAAVARINGDRGLEILLLRHRGDAHEQLEQIAEAKTALTRSRDLAVAAFGADSREVAEVQLRLAIALRSAGESTQARELAETALARLTALVGADHPLIGSALMELAATAHDLDDYDAVVDYMNRVIAIYARTTGTDSLPMAKALWNLGGTQALRGQLEEARRLFARSLEIRERALGPDDPAVAQSLEGLAQVHQWRGEVEPALGLLQRSLAIKTKHQGPDHPDVAASLALIGATLASNGAPAEALRYYERSLDVRTRVLGKDHPASLESEVLVASTLHMLDRCDDARPLLAHAITALEHLGASPVEALQTRAECELTAGDARSAAITAQRAITACEATSKNNPMCSSRYWVRARALAKLGRTAEALAAATEAMRRAAANESPEEAAEIRAWIAARRPR